LSTKQPKDPKKDPSIGKTLFEIGDERKLDIPTSCGRNGECHECVVEITTGMQTLSAPSEPESFLEEPYRLACQAIVMTGGPIRFAPLRRSPKILATGQQKVGLELEPMVTKRGGKVFYAERLIDEYRGHLLGLAIDLGTTTIVIDLVDLESGQSIERLSFENPQKFGGSDVMHRISYDAGPHKGELKKALLTTINRTIRNLARSHRLPRRSIYEIVVAGNSSMRDLLFGLNVQGIGQRPYKSLTELEYRQGLTDSTELLDSAWRIGIRANKETVMYGLPLIASHVGGDTAACLTAIDIQSVSDTTVMLIDVGTNTEVVIGNSDRMVAASCPAGPAFEGGLVKYGMPGYEGAIESIRIQAEDNSFDYQTIGGIEPTGLCGSGLIDLVAELRRHGRMTEKGVFQPDKKQTEITVVPEHGITFSRADASALAQATAANYCGQFIAMRYMGLQPDEISSFYLAGGFANYVNVGNAIEIGFLAPIRSDRIIKVGNASIDGACELLMSTSKREQLRKIVKKIEHVELETTADFFDIFVEGCQFKPMPIVIEPGP
jgi:uncharacterized 2Fe-2S/4Fe-4S cluster protein (DUF4445 family)